MDSSVPSILPPRVRVPSTPLRFYCQILYCNCLCVEKRMKINKKRLGLAHILKTAFSIAFLAEKYLLDRKVWFVYNCFAKNWYITVRWIIIVFVLCAYQPSYLPRYLLLLMFRFGALVPFQLNPSIDHSIIQNQLIDTRVHFYRRLFSSIVISGQRTLTVGEVSQYGWTPVLLVWIRPNKKICCHFK